MSATKRRSNLPSSEVPSFKTSKNHKLPIFDAGSDGTPSTPPSLPQSSETSAEPDCQQHPAVISPETNEHISEAVKHWDSDEVAYGMTPPDVSDGDDHHVSLIPEEKRKIFVTDQELPDLTDLAINAIVASNHPPRLFKFRRSLARIVFDDRQNALIEPLTEAALRGLLSRCVSFFKVAKDYHETWISAPKEVIQDIMTLVNWPLPSLHGITESPMINLSTGRITTALG